MGAGYFMSSLLSLHSHTTESFLFSLIELLRLTSVDDNGIGNGYWWRHQSGVGSGIFEPKRHLFGVDTDAVVVGCSNLITQSSNHNEHYGQSTSVTKILRGMHADKKSGVWPDTLVVRHH